MKEYFYIVKRNSNWIHFGRYVHRHRRINTRHRYPMYVKT